MGPSTTQLSKDEIGNCKDDDIVVDAVDSLSIGKNHTGGSDVLRRSIPPRRRRLRRKKLQTRSPDIQPDELVGETEHQGLSSPLYFWNTLGEVRSRGVSFSWPTDSEAGLGYSNSLGRVYYKSFLLRGMQFFAGDFVWRVENGERSLHRILSAYQATKSFMGYWSMKAMRQKEELQKRGEKKKFGEFRDIYFSQSLSFLHPL